MSLVLPTEDQQALIRKELNENPETCNEDLEVIKTWLKEQPHLPDTWDTDCLVSFLRGCRYNVEACKKKLDKYFSVRNNLPEFFSNRDIKRKELRDLCQIFQGAVLPDLTPDGKRVSVGKAAKQDFQTPNLEDLVKIVFMVGDLRLKMEKTGVHSDVYILDAGFPLAKHFLRINPLIIRKMFICIQEAYPVRIKEIHMINAPPFIEFVINMIRPFLTEALRDAMHVHTKIETLYEFVPKEILPEDYGGNAGKVEDLMGQWLETLEEYSWWFEGQESVKADETKRVGNGSLWSYFWGL